MVDLGKLGPLPPIHRPRKPVILFRKTLADGAEIEAAEKYFPVVYGRAAISPGSLVIPRYSALPFNRELEEDVESLGGRLINSNFEHSQLADLESWYPMLEDLTPTTWFGLNDARASKGPFVLKGTTNSKKQHWATHMYAADWHEALRVQDRLLTDGLIGSQKIVVREYMPLRKLMDSISPFGPPVSEEYRFFVLRKRVIASGFYWSSYIDDIYNPKTVSPSFVPEAFLAEIIKRVGDIANFFVVDVARVEDGRWIVVELNDGCMAGLCSIDPDDLYSELYKDLCA